MDPLGESPWADAPAQTIPSSTSEPTAAAGDDATSKAAETTSSAAGPAAATGGGGSGSGSSSSGPRPSRLTPRRLVAQPTKLQAVEDDPLGPLGAAGQGGAEGAPPMPPQKEGPPTPAAMASTLPVRTTMGSQAQRKGVPADPHRIDEDDNDENLQQGGGIGGDGDRIGGRAPPPVQAAMPVAGSARGMGPPSVSVEQAAKPIFEISVGDPHKVGDLTSSHIVYSVRTKVCAGLYRLGVTATSQAEG